MAQTFTAAPRLLAAAAAAPDLCQPGKQNTNIGRANGKFTWRFGNPLIKKFRMFVFPLIVTDAPFSGAPRAFRIEISLDWSFIGKTMLRILRPNASNLGLPPHDSASRLACTVQTNSCC